MEDIRFPLSLSIYIYIIYMYVCIIYIYILYVFKRLLVKGYKGMI